MEDRSRTGPGPLGSARVGTERVAKVLDAALMAGRDGVDLSLEAEAQPSAPLPLVVSPWVSGICSSGSTGTPKVIMDHTPAVLLPSAQPFPAAWGVEVGTQRILVPTALYHTNGSPNSPTCWPGTPSSSWSSSMRLWPST